MVVLRDTSIHAAGGKDMVWKEILKVETKWFCVMEGRKKIGIKDDSYNYLGI
jgi:hypothetical protein